LHGKIRLAKELGHSTCPSTGLNLRVKNVYARCTLPRNKMIAAQLPIRIREITARLLSKRARILLERFACLRCCFEVKKEIPDWNVLVCARFEGASMKCINFLVAVTLAAGVTPGFLTTRMLNAQNTENLKSGTVLQRTELKGAPGWEAILVLRELPPGAESGKHTQAGNEIAYVQEGTVIFEAQGKPAVTLKPGETFTTSAGEVHNVKNASSTAPAKSLVFYVAKKGARLEDLATPAK
jgi:quercetin dioxygenase-like cupin family protein